MHNSKIGKITYSKSQFITTYGNSKNKRLKKKKKQQKIEHVAFFKKNFMVPFYGWGSTVMARATSRRQFTF